MIKNPIDLLMPYQRQVYDDASRFIAWCAGRQSGKSFTGAAWSNKKCRVRNNESVLIASPSERQSLEACEKCKQWAAANDVAIKEELQERDAPGALMKSDTIIFENGSRIIAVPGKPDTVRGFSAHVWCDEFGFFEDPAATWKAILPAISNQLKGKKCALLTSTPNGKSGRGKKFFDIITDKGKIDIADKNHYMSGVWSCYRTTILDAAPYLGTDVDELRAAIDDEEAWAQEFMCEFIDGSKVLLPYTVIQACEDITAKVDPSEVLERDGEFYAGIDFGRTNDPTIMWIVEKIAERKYRTMGVIPFTNTNTVDQFVTLRPYIAKCRKVCVDYTGPGVGFGDICAKEFGAEKNTDGGEGVEKIELCNFTQPFKCDIFPKLRTALDGCDILLPIDVDCREDLHEMQQVVNNGKYNYTARRTAEGHSDRCTALALARRATTFEMVAACEPPEDPVGEGYKYTRGW